MQGPSLNPQCQDEEKLIYNSNNIIFLSVFSPDLIGINLKELVHCDFLKFLLQCEAGQHTTVL